MIRQDFARVDSKRRSYLDPKKKQFAQPLFKHQDYQHRLNFYVLPPTAEISLEEFEEWAINRLKGAVNRKTFHLPQKHYRSAHEGDSLKLKTTAC